MFSGPKEKYTGIKIRYKDLSLDFGNRFMWFAGVIIICWFISRSERVSVVAEDLLSGEHRTVKLVLSKFSAMFPAHRAPNQVVLPGNEQVHHQAQDRNLIPEERHGRAPSGQNGGQDSVDLEHQEVGYTKGQEDEPAEEPGK